ncbi:MAG: nuclear transport factor 2 family protein [Planctomycetota bacterium]|nr:nuclear transport factor 2 family protein [Planctomycetota bacterium]
MKNIALIVTALCMAPSLALAQDQNQTDPKKPSRWEPLQKPKTPAPKKKVVVKEQVKNPGLRGALAGEKKQSLGRKTVLVEEADKSRPLEVTGDELKTRYLTELDRNAPLSSEERTALETAETFYKSLVAKDIAGIRSVLSPKAEFSDPAYPHLKGNDVQSMWHLITESDPLSIEYKIYKVEGSTVYGGWVADYELFGRPIHNVIKSKITVKDGKIVFHKDSFDFDRWSEQALPSFANKGLGLLGKQMKYKALRLVTVFALHNFKKEKAKQRN